MGSRIFKYKKGPNYAYAPGEITPGVDGEKGNAGKNGPGIYFVNYDLNNSKNKDLALQKISEGYLLGHDSKIKIDREYSVGDLIISSSLNCYKIVSNDGTFDIEYIGNIKSTENMALNNISKIVVYDVTNTTINFTDSDSSVYTYTYSSDYMAPAPTSENAPFSIPNVSTIPMQTDKKYYDLMVGSGDPETSRYRKGFNKHGNWYKVAIYMNDDYESYKDITFNIVNDVNCKKSQISDSFYFGQGGSCVLDDFSGCINHNKSIVFRSKPIPSNDYENNFLFNEIIRTVGQTKMNDSSVDTLFISSTFADRLHTFGNDYKISMIQSPDGKRFTCDNNNIWAENPTFTQNSLDLMVANIGQPSETPGLLKMEAFSYIYALGNSTYFSSILAHPSSEPSFENSLNDFILNGNSAYAYVAEQDDNNSASEINTIKVTIEYDDTTYKGKTFDASIVGGYLKIE